MGLFSNGDSMLVREILGIPVFVIIEGIAVTTGCGGGGLIVPTCMYLLDMSPKEASALSQALMFGAAFASLLIDWNRKEQDFNVPLIDIDLLLFMGPTLMSGALVGGLVNRASPNWFIIFSLIFVLAISGFKTLHKGYKTMQRNRANTATINRSMSKINAGTEHPSDDEFDEFDEPGNQGKKKKRSPEKTRKSIEMANAGEAGATTVEVSAKDTNSAHQKYFDEVAPVINMKSWQTLLFLWLFNLVMLVVRGSPKNESFVGLKSGSAGYWCLTGFIIIFLGSLGLYFGYLLEQRTKNMDPAYVEFLHNKTFGTTKPKEWTMDEIYFLSPAIFFAGIVSGTVGIGGGMILGPLMLMVEIPPQVIASCNTTSILLSSSSLACLYIVDDAIDPGYAAFYCFWTFVGAYVGKAKTKEYFKKNDFVLVYIMSGVILSSWALVFIKVVEEIQYIDRSGWDAFQAPE